MAVRPISQLLSDLEGSLQSNTISLEHILHEFRERSFGFFIFLFALPCALPVPAVGYGTILGIPLILLTAQQTIGRKTIWLPQTILKKEISSETIRGLTSSKTLNYVKFIESIIKPRLGWLTTGIIQQIIGLLSLIMACFVCLPLPLTNTVPSLGLAVIAAGVMMRDGLAVIAGLLIGLVWCSLLSYFMITLGVEGAVAMKDMVKSYM